jgi:hypothetical protein
MPYVAEFIFGTVIIDDDENEPQERSESSCKNCGEETHTPDDHTGLIHTHGQYGCLNDKGKWVGTVAE